MLLLLLLLLFFSFFYLGRSNSGLGQVT